MLTYEQCLEMCGLTEEEVKAIAEHEHMPRIVAAEYGNYLMRSAQGAEAVRDMIVDDIRAATVRGDRKHAAALMLVLRKFAESHKEELAVADAATGKTT